MSFACRICDRTFETIPDGSVEIGRAHGRYQMVRFPDGAVHDLMRLVDPLKPANELLSATVNRVP
jgi:hypothetical protein